MSGTYDPRITAYFGDAVLQAGFMPLPHLFLRHYRSLGLSQVQAMFVLQLMEIAWDVGDPPNTASKIAARMGLSQRSVRACSKEVHDLGLIEIYDQWDDAGAQVENAYDLSPLFHRLADLAPVYVPTGQARTRRQRNNPHSGATDIHPTMVQDVEATPTADEHLHPATDTGSTALHEATVAPVQVAASGPMHVPTSPPHAEIFRGDQADFCIPSWHK